MEFKKMNKPTYEELEQKISILEKKNEDIIKKSFEQHNKLLNKHASELTKINQKFRKKIDEYKKVEKKLKESEEKLRTIVQAVPNIVYRINSNGKFTFINNAIIELGYKPEELIGMHFSEIILPADVNSISRSNVLPKYKGKVTGDKYAPKLFDERRTGERMTKGLEIQLVSKNSKNMKMGVVKTIGEEVITAEVNSSGMYEINPLAKNKVFIGTAGIISDITELTQAKISLVQSKEYLHNIIDSSLDMIITVDRDRRIVEFNTSSQKTFGYNKEDILGKHIQTLYADKKEGEMISEEVFKKDIFIGEINNIRKNGEVFPCILSASIIRDQHGEIIGAVGNSRDITDQKKAEKALRESEERYRLFVQNFQGIAYQCDTNFKLRLLHGTVEVITGYKVEDFVSGKIIWEEIIHPDDISGFNNDNKKLLSIPHYSCVRKYRIIHKSSETRWIREIVSNICDDKGNPKLIQGAVYDITENVKSKELADMQRLQLIQADKMASLGALVSGVAHEINNPTQYIMSNTSILQNLWKNIEPVIEKNYKEYSDFSIMNMSYSDLRENILPLFSGILNGADRIKYIVQELRDFARHGSNEMNDIVDINAVVESAILLNSNMIKKTTENFSTHLEEELPTIKGNFRRLEQVIINLIQNACQALSDSKSAILASTSYDRKADCIMIEVKDEGTGMHKDVMNNITDPFYTTKRDSGGTGLGLSISSTIINEHGGNLIFESIPGKGTTAKVILPLKGYIEKRKDNL